MKIPKVGDILIGKIDYSMYFDAIVSSITLGKKYPIVDIRERLEDGIITYDVVIIDDEGSRHAFSLYKVLDNTCKFVTWRERQRNPNLLIEKNVRYILHKRMTEFGHSLFPV